MKFISTKYPNLSIHHPTGSNILGMFVNSELETEDVELIELLQITPDIEMLVEETQEESPTESEPSETSEKPKSTRKRGK